MPDKHHNASARRNRPHGQPCQRRDSLDPADYAEHSTSVKPMLRHKPKCASLTSATQTGDPRRHLALPAKGRQITPPPPDVSKNESGHARESDDSRTSKMRARWQRNTKPEDYRPGEGVEYLNEDPVNGPDAMAKPHGAITARRPKLQWKDKRNLVEYSN